MNKATIQSITANYSRLQGLRSLPVGALLFFTSLWTVSHQGDLGAPLLVTIAAVIVYAMIDRYYKNAFGQVRQTRQQRSREVAVSILFAVVALSAFVVDSADVAACSMIGVVFSFAMIWEYLQAILSSTPMLHNKNWENLAAGLIFLLLSLLPLTGIMWWLWLGVNSLMQGMLTVIGIVIILVGIIGHFRVVRILPVTEL